MDRSKNYVVQVIRSFLTKAIAMVCSFMSVPLTIHYLGVEKYGVWATILSILMWVTFFDLGIGNGLRNKLAESLAEGNLEDAKSYVSSAYTLIGAISLVLFLVLFLLATLVPWQNVLNTKGVPEDDLRIVIIVVGLAVSLNFWLGLINQVLNAYQTTSIVTLGQALNSALVLLFIFLLTIDKNTSLLLLAGAYSIALVASSLSISIWFYARTPHLVPRFGLVARHARPLLSLGLKFFTIQISSLIIFMTDKLLITQFFGPSFVTQYDVIFKFFSVFTLAHGLISGPLWSAYTDAYARDDKPWIKRMLVKQMLLFVLFVLGVVILVLLTPWITMLWIGPTFVTPWSLTVAMGAFVAVSAWNNIFGFVLGGINKIRLGSISSVFIGVMNIPLCYLFAIQLSLGVPGIVLGTVTSLLFSSIVSPLQVYYFVFSRRHQPTLTRILR